MIKKIIITVVVIAIGITSGCISHEQSLSYSQKKIKRLGVEKGKEYDINFFFEKVFGTSDFTPVYINVKNGTTGKMAKIKESDEIKKIIKFLNRLKFKLSDYQNEEPVDGWSYCFDIYNNKKQFIRMFPNSIRSWEIRGLYFDVIPPSKYVGKMETKEEKIKATIYSESDGRRDGRKELEEFLEYIKGYVN